MALAGLVLAVVLLIAIPFLIAIMAVALSLLQLLLFWIVIPFLLVKALLEIVRHPGRAHDVIDRLHLRWSSVQHSRARLADMRRASFGWWKRGTFRKVPADQTTDLTTTD